MLAENQSKVQNEDDSKNNSFQIETPMSKPLMNTS